MESYSDLLQTPPVLMMLLFAGLLGLVIGSFLNVVIARLPTMLERAWSDAYADMLGQPVPERQTYNLARPGSHCPSCQHTLRWYELIPLLSWCVLRGRCAHCHSPISWQYPLVELASTVLTVACVWRFGWHGYTLAALVFCLTLLTLSVIDLRTFLLPDDLTLPLLWLGLILAAAGWGQISAAAAIAGAAIGYGALWILANTYRWISGREGMGQGDFKLLAALGAWLGPQALPSIVLVASVLGLVAAVVLIIKRRANRRSALPFGPCLAAAGILHLFLAYPAVSSLTFG